MRPGWTSNAFIYIALILGAVALLFYFLPMPDKPEEVPLSEVIAMSQKGQIAKIEIEEDTLLVTTLTGAELKTFKESNTSIYEIKNLNLEGVTVNVKGSTGINWGSLLLNLLPFIVVGFIFFLLLRQARGANSQAMNFGRSRARMFAPNRTNITFNDVAGVDEAKQDLQEVVEFLKSREKFQKLGARIPKGVLLVGPPGTGKTLMAKAVAGEANVPFFSISGSEFVEMFVGVGASRVRDLFDQAKRNAPCIVFIDEIDAVGRHRGAGLGGSHDEREQTLNQILVEMDGFDTSTSVVVMAATNRPDILDPALLRPGRFDRRIILDRPDINGRIAILKVHIKGKPLDESVNLETLAKATVGFSGADIANLVNEAALLAARRNKSAISMKEFEESIDRVIAGPERKSRKISQKEKEITAYHEAGHTLVAKMLPNADPVHKVSIVARGMSLGHTKQLPTEDRYLLSRSQIMDKIATYLGGRVAEELIFKDITSGAAEDIEQATKLARAMVTSLGMSDKLGPRTFGDRQEMVFLGREIAEQKDYSDETAKMIDDEVYRIIQEGYSTARKILTENKDKLVLLSTTLIAQETLEGAQLDALLGTASPATPQEVKVKPEPVPVAPAGEVKPAPAPKKQREVPQLVPEHKPAPSE